MFALNNGAIFTSFTTKADNIVICYGYIGTNIGIYATSNGQPTAEYADFDWVSYEGYQR